MPPTQDDTHTGFSPSDFPDLLYIYNTADFTNSIFHFKFLQAAIPFQTFQKKQRTMETQ